MLKHTLFVIAKRLSQVSALRQPIIRLWNTYEHALFVSSARRNLSAQSTVAHIDPLQLYLVDPKNINRMSGNSFDFIRDTGRVTDGSWDLDSQDAEETSVYKRFEKRFLHGHDWNDISYYQRKKDRIKTGEDTRYMTVTEFEEKLVLYDRLYEQISSEGYRLQSELVADGKSETPGDGGKTIFPSLTNHTLLRHEISVNVGRHGEILYNDGRHRLAVALLIGLEEVPVRIVVRHSEWQSLRDKIAQTIDDALNNILESDNVKSYVRDVLSDDLKDVNGGVDHPDLDIIFHRHLHGEQPTSDRPYQTIPWVSVG